MQADLAEARKLYERHLKRRFPKNYGGAEIGDVDLVLLGADIAGCLSVYFGSRGKLDQERIRILRTRRAELHKIVPLLIGEARDYFTELERAADAVAQDMKA